MDQSLLSRGFATATTEQSVELTWKTKSPSVAYDIVRGATVIGRVTGAIGYYKDMNVRPSRTYVYRVTPADGSAVQDSWGTAVTTPERATSASSVVAELKRSVTARRGARCCSDHDPHLDDIHPTEVCLCSARRMQFRVEI